MSLEKEVLDNIFERIASGKDIEVNELDSLLDDVNIKLGNLSNRRDECERILEKEVNAVENTQPTCHSDSLTLQCFLNNVVQALERNPGLEEFILNYLVDFCFQNSIVLPPLCNLESIEGSYQDLGSLNSMVEKTEEENQLLWAKICGKFKVGIMKQIKELPIPNSKEISKNSTTSSSGFVIERLLSLYRQLLCIFTFESVVDMHCKIRRSQLDETGSKTKECSVSFADVTSASIHRSIKMIGKFANLQVCMMHTDVYLMQSISSDVSSTVDVMQKLFKVYSENLVTHVEKLTRCYKRLNNDFVEFDKKMNCDSFQNEKTFTTNDLRNFSNVFCILDIWSTNVNDILKEISTDGAMGIVTESSTSSMDWLVRETSFHSNETIWDWKALFSSYLPIFKQSIPSYIQCVCNVVIESRKCEKEQHDGKLVEINRNFFEENTNCPVRVSTHCGTLISLVNDMVIFALPNQQNAFNELSTVTLNSLIERLNDHHADLQEVFDELERNKSSINKLYRLLADLSLITIQLRAWNELLSSQIRENVLQEVISNTSSTMSACTAAIIKYHIGVLKCSLSFDIHGNHWDDDKPFFEGERCSFVVQMWNYYIQGVLYDLKKYVSETSLKYILWEIGIDVLEYFTTRYSAIKPSYRRLKQFKGDILVLLSTFKWLLLHIVDNMKEYSDVRNEKTRMWHTLCMHLLDIIVIITSPLDQLCLCVHTETNDNRNKPALCWYDQVGQFKISEHHDCIQLDILMKQRTVNWNMLIELLSLNNSALAFLLVKYSDHLVEPKLTDTNYVDTNMNEMFSGGTEVTFEPVQGTRLVSTIVSLFMRLHKVAFIDFMASLIKDDNSKSFKVPNDQLPLWLRAISKELSPIFKHIFEPAIQLLLMDNKHKVSPFAFTKLQKLPCACPTVHQNNQQIHPSDSDVLHKCLMVTLESVVKSMSLIPGKIWDLLVYIKANAKFTQSWIKLPNLGTKLLASLLYNWLITEDNIKHVAHDVKLSSEIFPKVVSFAELLWHILYHLSYDVTDNSNISMVIHKDLQMSGAIITEKLNKIHDYFDRATLSYQEGAVNNMEDVQSFITPEDKEGMALLKYVFSILKANQVLIKELLQDNFIVTATWNENFHFPTYDNMENFNPFHSFQHISSEKIEHFKFLEGILNWKQLIESVQLSKLKTMIFNRFEFHENMQSFLTSDEKENVSKMKDLLGME